MTFELPKKDMVRVEDYNRKRQLEIFRGQCFNNASVILSDTLFDEKRIFDVAQLLYDEGIKRKWI